MEGATHGAGAPDLPSARVRLARLALDAALTEPGVAGPHESLLHFTLDGARRLPGVVCVAERDGRYAVSLHLVARPVPLLPLMEAVQQRVRESAAVAGLGAVLGTVSVRVEDVALADSARELVQEPA